MALDECGCHVEAVCPSGHPLTGTRAVARTQTYRNFAPIACFGAAIDSSAPDVVIPCDELAANILYCLHAEAGGRGRTATSLLLERSLGDPSSYALLRSRAATLAVAQHEGVTVPETAAIRNVDELLQWLVRYGYPAVVKSDGTAGGRGVRVVRTPEEARRAFQALCSPPSAARAFKRALVDRDLTLLVPWVSRERPRMSVQRFVAGREATSTFACWGGKVLSSVSFDVVKTWKPGGPASVLELNDNREISSAAGKLASSLKLSGFYGLDFIMDECTGRANLIEVNPRATQTCHLAFGPGRDLPASLAAAITGDPVHERGSGIMNRQVALFPLEFERDPASRFLKSAYHDVPWEEPTLVTHSLREPKWSLATRSYEAWNEYWSRRRVRAVPGLAGSKERPPTR